MTTAKKEGEMAIKTRFFRSGSRFYSLSTSGWCPWATT